jgi:flavin reductase (DIM6/NTAB) family NADH-FMN oxidoreductase RutF
VVLESPAAPDARSLRDTLARFATGVVVAAAWDPVDARYIGMTLSSFSSVSLDPPLILFSIDRRARSLAAWRRVPGYAINVLERGQRELSERFARPDGAKWEGVRFETGEHAAPLLSGALAHFECLPHAECDGGDHVTLFGRVVRCAPGIGSAPLVFFGSRYVSLQGPQGSEPAQALAESWPLSIHY